MRGPLAVVFLLIGCASPLGEHDGSIGDWCSPTSQPRQQFYKLQPSIDGGGPGGPSGWKCGARGLAADAAAPAGIYDAVEWIDVDENCFCDNPDVLGDAGVFNGDEQARNTVVPTCKWLDQAGNYSFANANCRIAYIDGFLQSPRGDNPDGDEGWDVCPFLGQGTVALTGEQRAAEIRSDYSFTAFEHSPGAVKIERLWCRTYSGQLEVRVPLPDAGFKDVCFSEVAPRHQYRFAAAGDWILDHVGSHEAHTEIHEPRITATILTDPDCDQLRECQPSDAPIPAAPCGPLYCEAARTALCERNDWHFLTQGFFAEGTWQEAALYLTASMPSPRDASGRPRVVVPGQDTIECGEAGGGFPAMPPPGATGVGCSRPNELKAFAKRSLPTREWLGSSSR